MKTSELIKKVEEFGNGLSVVITNETLMLFADNGQTLICTVDETTITTQKEIFAVNSPISNAIELMFEYAKTPLEEREEEKKYRLHLPRGFAKRSGYLNFDKGKDEYVFSDRRETREIQTSFTQKEINTMPAFTAWLLKEEV